MKRCKVCGKECRIVQQNAFYSKCKTNGCITGPVCDTFEEAEAAWDKLMGGETLTCETVRKPVGVFSATRTYATCNDGTIWEWAGSGWFQMLPIPGTEADR
jgi:hypothetical protein